MAANEYWTGSTVKIKGVFTGADGLPGDPTKVTIQVRVGTTVFSRNTDDHPSELLKEADGEWYLLYEITEEGWHYVRVDGDGTINQAKETAFLVKTSNF